MSIAIPCPDFDSLCTRVPRTGGRESGLPIHVQLHDLCRDAVREGVLVVSRDGEGGGGGGGGGGEGREGGRKEGGRKGGREGGRERGGR